MSATVPPLPAALILSGGGARAAYQVGTLRAIAHMVGRRKATPFPVICGTSAGAINAAMLAAHADDFRRGVARLLRLWRKLRISDVYYSDMPSLSRLGLRWLASVVTGRNVRTEALSMLDNAPLRKLLEREVDFGVIGKRTRDGHLTALTINATSYRSGQSVTFVQGNGQAHTWERVRRHAELTAIGVDHLMASVAIPFIFPAARIGDDYFMDGSVRQIAPLAPALHLGAGRLFVLAVGHFFGGPQKARLDNGAPPYPSFATTASHALSSVFLDNLAADLERLVAVNRMIDRMAAADAISAGADVGHVDALLMAPTIDLGARALDYVALLPPGVRALLRGLGAMQEGGSTMMSYLMFDRDYCRLLIRQGFADAMARRTEIEGFLSGERIAGVMLPHYSWD
ncbi:MAG TPA: patatin-like phospholipase family protein [Casimicrobiaceae bacterium]|jgi:NTE family protein